MCNYFKSWTVQLLILIETTYDNALIVWVNVHKVDAFNILLSQVFCLRDREKYPVPIIFDLSTPRKCTIFINCIFPDQQYGHNLRQDTNCSLNIENNY